MHAVTTFKKTHHSSANHDDAERVVDHAEHAHDVGRAHAHHDHGLLVQRSAGAGVHFVQLLDRHVKALPLGTIHRSEGAAADLSAHGKRGRALDVACCARGQLVGLEVVPTLLGGSFASLDECDQLRLKEQGLKKLRAGCAVNSVALQHAVVADVDLARNAGGRQQRTWYVAARQVHHKAWENLRGVRARQRRVAAYYLRALEQHQLHVGEGWA
jgi:hypothetical protein